MLKIGITGTRNKDLIQDIQFQKLKLVFTLFKCTVELHHGDCTGADELGFGIAQEIRWRTVSHPPLNNTYRAFTHSDLELPAKNYSDRNRDIVDSVFALVGVSATMKEVSRSGTWSTIRYARKMNRELHIILPDGSIVRE